MSGKSDASLKIAAMVAGAVLLLAGVLGWKGVLPPGGIFPLVALAVGGFVAVALKDRWKRIRWGGGEIEMRGATKPLIAFIESSFFPIPPDVLLMALCFAHPKKWAHFAFWCTVGSVAGGVFGWWIGHAFWEALAPWFFTHVPGFTEDTFQKVEGFYRQNAFLFILTAAFTPIPYKVFTVASGVFAVPIATLVSASILGRAGRFFLVAAVIRLGGPSIRPHIEKYLEVAVTLLFLLGVAGFMAIRWLK
ncbi:MAG: DedA family protein [Verrucomicrobia bacterium]|nr:DedA family protein [Verrucomicrobiota bacterium]